jgi:hypothetical protein
MAIGGRDVAITQAWDQASRQVALENGHAATPRRVSGACGNVRWIYFDADQPERGSFSVISKPETDGGVPFIWRLAKGGRDYGAIRARLAASRFATAVVPGARDIDVPLDVDLAPRVWEMTDALVARIREVEAVAAGFASQPLLSKGVDVDFRVIEDMPEGQTLAKWDPDAKSRTLRRYHQLLWSKALPDGTKFTLTPRKHGVYLHHQSRDREFFLSSDGIGGPSYVRRPETLQVDPADINSFRDLYYTVAGFIVFPGNRIDGKLTINQARGLSGSIADRFDLTLECIRLHYEGTPDTYPLKADLARYANFFALFGDFHGYVDFFLLQDLVDESYRVRFHIPNRRLGDAPIPQGPDEYRVFRTNAMEFLRRRNQRIADWARANLG